MAIDSVHPKIVRTIFRGKKNKFFFECLQHNFIDNGEGVLKLYYSKAI